MNGKALFMILLASCTILSCEKDSYSEPLVPPDSFYFTSFESPADTTGWFRIGLHNRVEDAPKVGGTYSVEISGGCVAPHAWYNFAPLTEDRSFLLKCWGKNLSHGGSVSLNTENYSGHINISVTEQEWTAYASEDTLHCTEGSILVLELNSGGIISSAMRVDQIEISEVD